MVTRGLGCIPDPRDARGNWDLDVCALQAQLPTTFGDVATLDRSSLFDGKVRNQGPSNSCVGHGLARAIQLRLSYQAGVIVESPCILDIFAKGRARAGVGVAADVGIPITAGVEAVIEDGFSRESLWPFEAGLVTSKPPWDVAQGARDQRGMLAHRVMGDAVQTLKASLIAGLGVAIGIDCDQSFLDFDGGVWGGMTGARLGGHCMAALDFDADGLRVINSHGGDWGDWGLAHIAWDYLSTEHLRSAWIIDFALPYSG